MVSIETKEGVIEVTSPYNPEFIDFAKMRGGKWSDEKEVWMFDPRDEFAVRSALIDIYGTDDYENCEKVDIRCDYSVAKINNWKSFVAGWEVARSHYGNVKLSDRTILVEGELRVYKDKVKPELRSNPILEVRAIPEKAAQKIYKENPDKVEIIGGIDESKLKDEKKKLQDRIQEINNLLETMKEDNKQNEGIIKDLKD